MTTFLNGNDDYEGITLFDNGYGTTTMRMWYGYGDDESKRHDVGLSYYDLSFIRGEIIRGVNIQMYTCMFNEFDVRFIDEDLVLSFDNTDIFITAECIKRLIKTLSDYLVEIHP